MIGWARTHITSLDRVWSRYWPFIEGLNEDQLNRRLAEGRTVKEILAHIAFWEEAAVGYVRLVIRGEEVSPRDWYRGSDLGLKENDPWPAANVHNAREAAWARNQSKQSILSRLVKARSSLIDLLGSVTPEEAEGLVGEYYKDEDKALHFEEHLSEMQNELSGENRSYPR